MPDCYDNDDKLPLFDLIDNPVIRSPVGVKSGQFMRQGFSFIRILGKGIDRFLDNILDRGIKLLDPFLGFPREQNRVFFQV